MFTSSRQPTPAPVAQCAWHNDWVNELTVRDATDADAPGSAEVGRLREVGRESDHWRDVVLMERLF